MNQIFNWLHILGAAELKIVKLGWNTFNYASEGRNRNTIKKQMRKK